MLSTLFRLGILAGFVAIARRVLAPHPAMPPRLSPPRASKRPRRAPEHHDAGV